MAAALVCGGVLFVYLDIALTRRFDEALADKARLFAAVSNQDEDVDGEELRIDHVPEIVRAAIHREAGENPVAEVERIVRGGVLVYKAETERDGVETDLLVSAAGEFLGIADEFNFALREAALPEFQPSPHAEYYQVWDEDGETIAKSRSLESASLPRPGGATDDASFSDLPLPDGRAGRAIALAFIPRQTPSAADIDFPETLHLMLARARGDLNATLRTIGFALAAAILSVVTATVLLAKYTVQQGLRPLTGLALDISMIDLHNLAHRIPLVALPAELTPIADRFNELLARIEAGLARERRFTGDVAHELRTPLTELRSIAEVALRSAGESPPDDDASRALHDIAEVSVQMECMVTALLTLARSNAQQRCVLSESVDLSDLVQTNWKPFETQARERRLSVECEIVPSVIVCTNRSLLGAILTNLFSNAVAHATPGGNIAIRLRNGERYCELRVANASDGLAPEDLPHLSEPFWKKDAARTNAEHSGLGLAVATELARLLECALRFELHAGCFIAILEFPEQSSSHDCTER